MKINNALYLFGLAFLVLIFFWKFLVYGLLPIPSDDLVGLYHPFRDLYANEYPNGIPYKNFLITDPIRQQYPWRELAIGELKEGKLPLWNPYTFSGSPFMANYQSAVFYPLNLLFFILPFHIAWSLLVILQPLLAGIFMYLYLQRMHVSKNGSLIGGIVYAFCGFNMVWLTWNTLGHVAIWLPLILYLKENILDTIQHKNMLRKLWMQGVLLVAAESMYLLAGHAQLAFYVFCISNIYLIVRSIQIVKNTSLNRQKIVRRLVVFFSVTAPLITFLTAIQTIPFIRFILETARSSDQNYISREGWFIPIQHLIQFFAPDFFGNPATLNYWGTWNYAELVGYIGVVPLIFVLVSFFFLKRKFVLFYTVLFLVALIFSVDNPIARLPYILHIPFFSTGQPTRLLFLADFALSVLAAFGFDQILKRKLVFKKVIFILAIILLFYGVISYITEFGNLPVTPKDISTAQRNLILPINLIFFTSVLFVFHQKIKYKYVPVLFSAGLISLVAFDLFRFGWKFTPFTDQKYLFPKTKITEYLSQQTKPFRVMATDSRILPPNTSIPYAIETVDGYDPLYLNSYGEFMSAWIRNKPDISPFAFNRILTPQNYDHHFASLLGVKYILSFDEISSSQYKKVVEEGTTKVYENIKAYPRSFFVENVIAAHSKQESIDLLYDKFIDLSKTAIVYEPVTLPNVPLDPSENVKIVNYENQEIRLLTHSNHKRLLVITNAYYPVWQAFIDGTKAEIYTTDYFMQGVVVEQGNHEVLLKTSLY